MSDEKKCNCCDTQGRNAVTIPYFSHEKDMERSDRTNKRLWIVVLVLIVALLGTNGAWIWYESQFIDVVTTETVDVDSSDGGNALGIIGDSNEVGYGTSDSNTDY